MDYTAITNAHRKQKEFFASGATRNIEFRLQMLHKLKQAILNYQSEIQDALWKDLHKSPEEAYLTETGIVLSELNNHIRHLKKWAKPRRVSTPLSLFPSSSYIINEPLGVALVVAPWNYPFQLLINPLIGSISAGCCTILKPSPESANLSAVITKMIRSVFEEEYISIFEGGRDVNTALFNLQSDIIFFTGSPALGKIVMQAAAPHLTPVILELGGKSPCIVHSDANIDLAARRIVWGKFMNAGQTCIAPDYIFVQAGIKDELLKKMRDYIQQFYGSDPQKSPFYPRIINQKAMQRLISVTDQQKVYCGGNYDINDLYIAPTILTNITGADAVMQDEIFGPVLPVMEYQNISEAIDYINSKEKPLAFYFFGDPATGRTVLSKTSSGGACINDTLMHIGNHNLPFGGVGNSGMGKYHGKLSFQVFSNQRSVVETPVWLDLPFRYIPYKYMKLIKKLL